MVTDVERVLVELKALLTERPSWGTDQLLARIARLEAEHRVDAEAFERFVRQFGHHLFDSFMGLMPRENEANDPPTDGGATLSAVDAMSHPRTHIIESEASCPATLQHQPSRSRPSAVPLRS